MTTNNAGLVALTTAEELAEVRAAGTRRESVKLRRTFNQKVYDRTLRCVGVERFWKVIGPANHPNLNSDLSVAGLKDWGII